MLSSFMAMIYGSDAKILTTYNKYLAEAVVACCGIVSPI